MFCSFFLFEALLIVAPHTRVHHLWDITIWGLIQDLQDAETAVLMVVVAVTDVCR